MINFFRNTNHIHFIGIGGIGMSGMAEFLHNHGFIISGSDIKKTERTKFLEQCGINISYVHDSKNITKCDLIVFSSAVKKSNPEIKKGKIKNIPIIKRAELLGELIKIKEISIAVAGTHGKTTTSSMLGNILFEYNLNPTLIIGGIVNKFNSNNISGSGNIIVVEADEFDKSFLSLSPIFSIINNLDLEHTDIYKNLNILKKTFLKFSNSVPFYGKTFLNADCRNLNHIIENTNRPKTTYGIYKNADIKASSIKYNNSKSTFTLNNKKDKIIINLNCPGEHNIYNALAAATVSIELDIPINYIKKGLESYSGVKRRFEIKYECKKNNIMIVDDYAHHPSEISATLNAAKKGWDKKIIAIFQPHLFSRTKNFYSDFAKALMIADNVIITDIYKAREKPIKGVSSQLIIDEMHSMNYKKIDYINEIEKIPEKIKNIVIKNNIIIFMGAGNINSIISSTIKNIEKKTNL